MALTGAVVVADDPSDARAADLVSRLAGARLLLVVPHPDDESLALGGLIRHALRRHAGVAIVQVTDGDNNPWPQRVLERRLRIGPAERRRWGQRRAGEMLRAMHHLGLDAASRRRLGWPDMGVTARLQTRGTEAIDAMADALRDAAPDILVFPALDDTHPDHATCHVMVRLAMPSLARRPLGLTYLVHGRHREDGSAPVDLPLDEAMRAAKRRAILAHASQVALARRRLLARAGATETFRMLPSCGSGDAPPPPVVTLPWQPPRVLHSRLQLTLAHAGGVHVWPWRDAPLATRGREIRLTLPDAATRGLVCARLEMRCTSPWIFDHWGWRDLTATGAARQAGT